MSIFSHISFVSVPVTDIVRARDFYRDKLGLRVLTDAPFGDSRWVLLEVADSRTQIHLDDKPGRSVSKSRLALPLVVHDLDEALEVLRDNGVEIVQEPKSAAWNPLVAYALIRDSENNVLLVADG
ncbi:VOC family protein [Roseitranquillus sediminis]|uniref:VOC family protein n=1 Tax=Roseitranquillus sediminis TaxID=2809051 RepID=UPI001D0C28F9|nr:VOC family protein [Roseitranquillus sediminis]MBM9595691.1 VOC family protein [Roseitranquillus sediminis]